MRHDFGIVIGFIGGQIAFGAYLFEIVYERCGRHAGEVAELPVEMAMIRVAIVVEQGIEALLLGADQLFGQTIKALEANQLLGR